MSLLFSAILFGVYANKNKKKTNLHKSHNLKIVKNVGFLSDKLIALFISKNQGKTNLTLLA